LSRRATSKEAEFKNVFDSKMSEFDLSQDDQRKEEYRAAMRAGAEAIEVGRETLEAASRQGEQLENAEKMADETSYKLDKAGRVLRGMTWSGWVANMFAKELRPPGSEDDEPYNNTNSKLVPSVYETVPPPCRDAAQAIQNYHANIKVLATCETEEQEETCHMICESMYEVAKKEVDKLFVNCMPLLQENQEIDTLYDNVDEPLVEETQAFILRLQKDLGLLKSRQDIKLRILQRNKREDQKERDEIEQHKKERETLELGDESDKKETSYRAVEIGFDDKDLEAHRILKEQDDHLDGLAQHLDELGNIAINLSEVTDRHSALVDNLDNKAEDILGKSRMVTRRADRLVQSKVCY